MSSDEQKKKFFDKFHGWCKWDLSFISILMRWYEWQGMCWIASDGTIIPVADQWHLLLTEMFGEEVWEMGYIRVSDGISSLRVLNTAQVEALRYLVDTFPEEYEGWDGAIYHCRDTRLVPRPICRIDL